MAIARLFDPGTRNLPAAPAIRSTTKVTRCMLSRLSVAALACLTAGCATSVRTGPDFTSLIKQMQPSVVNIKGDEISRGTGFIVHSKGYILTAKHVVDGIDNITVTLSSGSTIEASVAALNEESDLVLLTIASDQPLHALNLHSGPPVRLGEWVVVLGNPFEG